MTSIPPSPTTGLSRLASNQEKAVALLAAKGSGNVGLREMATALEITAGAFYHHFAGKDDYLNFLLEAHYTELLATVAISKAARPSLSATVGRMVDLHMRRECYFILAAREYGELQRQDSDSAIGSLRHKINQHLVRAVDIELVNQPGCACLGLLEHLLLWTAEANLLPSDRKVVIARLLAAGMKPAPARLLAEAN